MKLALTWPRGLRSAICSGRGRLAGASALGVARFAAQFPTVETCAGAMPAPNEVPDVNGIRCSTARICAPVRSKPPPDPKSEPTPEPKPISSIGGMIARGTPDSTGAGVIPPDSAPFPAPAVCGAAAARAAKLAIGRALISAWRIASRVKSWTNCERRKRTSIFAGCTLTSTSS